MAAQRAVPADIAAVALGWQRTIGNRAAHAALQRVGARTLARDRVTVEVTSGTVTSVSFRGVDRPAIPGGQGDHTTSYQSFTNMIRSRLMGLSIAESKTAMSWLLEQVMQLPAVTNPEPTLRSEIGRRKANAETLIDAISDRDTLGDAAWAILAVRQVVPETSRPTSHKSTGRESTSSAFLKEIEDALRNGRDPKYDAESYAEWLWMALDFVPYWTSGDDVVALVYSQHIASMVLSFPRLFTHFSKLKDTMVTVLADQDSEAHKHLLQERNGKQNVALIAALRAYTPPAPVEPGNEGAPAAAAVGGYNLRDRKRARVAY